MQVIALCSQKGGSGKTTLAGHLAVQAERAGAGPVALIDCDPQGSLAAWWNSRKADTPAFVATTLPSLADDLDTLRDARCRLVFVDTPPAISMAIQRVMQHADLILIPTRPSPHDLRAVAATLDLAENVRRPVVFALNGATARARITADAAVALSQHGTVAPAFIHHRTSYASSMIDGRTAVETDPDGNAAREIAGLWAYVAGQLDRLQRRKVFRQPDIRGFGRRGGGDDDMPPHDEPALAASSPGAAP